MSINASRRQFVAIAPFGLLPLLAACSPPAPTASPTPPPAAPAPMPAPPSAGPLTMLDENDPQAVALGYVADASQVDTAKHANFVAGSQCSNCALYQGQPGDAQGPCTIFGGKVVAAAGWCTTWARRA